MQNLFEGFDLTASSKVVSQNATTKSKTVRTSNKKEKQLTNQSLFSGEELADFNIELNKPKVDVLLGKLNNTDGTDSNTSKVLKSKSLTLEEKLEIIRIKVLEVLGKQRKNVVVVP